MHETATAVHVFSVATAALPALRFVRDSRGSGNDSLRMCCSGGDLPSASIAGCDGIGGMGRGHGTYQRLFLRFMSERSAFKFRTAEPLM